MAGKSQNRCHVCTLPGSSALPLWTGPWRNNRSGKITNLTVHLGKCSESLTERYTYQQPGGTVPKETETIDPLAPADDPTPEGEKVREVLDQEPGPLPAVVDGDDQADDTTAEAAELVDGEAVNIPSITSVDVMRYIRYNEPLPEFDSADVARAIALELLDAPTLQDAMEPNEMAQAEELTWRNLTVHGVKWQPADKRKNPDAFPVYAVMDVTVADTNQRTLVTCGGLNVVAIMIKADLAREWPVNLRLTTVTTRNGTDTYKVEPWTEQDGNGSGF